MDLKRIINRQSPPTAWSEGDNIPWHEPGFSERMLKEHLSQDHDLASRRFEIIDRHVDWINGELLPKEKSRILDLGCGPGFYLQRLAERGHECVGIDYSPASIAFAEEQANKEKLTIRYRQEDVRVSEFGSGYDLVTFIYGEFNVFAASDVEKILNKAYRSLKPGGCLLLEVHNLDALREFGRQSASWYSARTGLFSEHPHICLQENFWNENNSTTTIRYFILDNDKQEMTAHSVSYQAYTKEQYHDLLSRCGFSDIAQIPSLTGTHSKAQENLTVITART
jgi:SAM-dependent methyltransferase